MRRTLAGAMLVAALLLVASCGPPAVAEAALRASATDGDYQHASGAAAPAPAAAPSMGLATAWHNCTDMDACPAATFTGVAGAITRVDCSGMNSCHAIWARSSSAHGSVLDISCTGLGSCKDMTINGPGSTLRATESIVQIECSGNSACQRMTRNQCSSGPILGDNCVTKCIGFNSCT